MRYTRRKFNSWLGAAAAHLGRFSIASQFTMSEQSSSDSSAADKQVVVIPLDQLKELMVETARSAVQAELSQHRIASASGTVIFSELVVGKVGAVSYDGHNVAHSIRRPRVAHFAPIQVFSTLRGCRCVLRPPRLCCRAYAAALILFVLLYLLRSITGAVDNGRARLHFCISATRVFIRCFSAFRLSARTRVTSGTALHQQCQHLAAGYCFSHYVYSQ